MFRRLSGGQFYGELIRCHALAGLTLTETRYPLGARLPRHCHEHAHFCLIRRGTYREEYGSRQRTCGPLMLAFHPPEEVHAEHIDGEEVRSFNIEITPSWLRGIAGATSLDQPSDFSSGPRASGTTDKEGQFHLVRDDEQDGAVVGFHRVLIQDARTFPPPRNRWSEGKLPVMPPSRISHRYANASDTPLRQEVKAGPQTITLELASK